MYENQSWSLSHKTHWAPVTGGLLLLPGLKKYTDKFNNFGVSSRNEIKVCPGFFWVGDWSIDEGYG